jgi:hypothetical protein
MLLDPLCLEGLTAKPNHHLGHAAAFVFGEHDYRLHLRVHLATGYQIINPFAAGSLTVRVDCKSSKLVTFSRARGAGCVGRVATTDR